MAFLTHNGSVVKVPGVGGSIVKSKDVISYPVKGDLINMTLGNATPISGTNNQYRVISINGSIAEVIAMYDMQNVAYNSQNITTYSSGELDAYLNETFYNSLNSTAKSAIVSKQIEIYGYESDLNAETPMHASRVVYDSKIQSESVNRYIYALDVEDIETYFNNSFAVSDIRIFFWKDSSYLASIVPWFRSIRTPYDPTAIEAWSIDVNGFIRSLPVNFDVAATARPAFKIDLSKIDFTIE